MTNTLPLIFKNEFDDNGNFIEQRILKFGDKDYEKEYEAMLEEKRAKLVRENKKDFFTIYLSLALKYTRRGNTKKAEEVVQTMLDMLKQYEELNNDKC